MEVFLQFCIYSALKEDVTKLLLISWPGRPVEVLEGGNISLTLGLLIYVNLQSSYLLKFTINKNLLLFLLLFLVRVPTKNSEDQSYTIPNMLQQQSKSSHYKHMECV